MDCNETRSKKRVYYKAKEAQHFNLAPFDQYTAFCLPDWDRVH